jgi:pimeloyl-ACP methyl ester carboxylesterase
VLAQAPSLPGLAGVQRWVLAGHSMGARVAAAVANEAAQPPLPAAVAAMLFSYPLHPPGKPQQLRDALLRELHLPTLLVRGDRDPFSQQAQWDAAVGGMAFGVCRQQHSVQGGDHSLHVAGGGSEAALQAVCAVVGQFLAGALQEQQQQEPGGAGRSSTAAAPRRGTGSAAGTSVASKRKAAEVAQPAASKGAAKPTSQRKKRR